MLGFLFSWFIGWFIGPKISCTKSQPLPNLRLTISSADHLPSSPHCTTFLQKLNRFQAQGWIPFTSHSNPPAVPPFPVTLCSALSLSLFLADAPLPKLRHSHPSQHFIPTLWGIFHIVKSFVAMRLNNSYKFSECRFLGKGIVWISPLAASRRARAIHAIPYPQIKAAQYIWRG